MQALDRVGLANRATDRPTRLSAGERQRVAVARALLNRPMLLLCDEPTGNLDAATGAAVLDIFLELNRRDNTTLVIATHESRVSEAASRQIVLETGRIVEA
jgi:putative ABC transport system ATP-binding protein